MLRIKILGLALVAVFMVGAIAASSAMATHQWLINGSPITSRVKVHSLGLLLLADTKALGGEVKIHCHGFDDGWVGPGNIDLILHISASLHGSLLGIELMIHCKFDKAGGCSEAKTPLLLALAVNLPWLTLIKLINGHVRDVIEKDPNANVSGNPGWKVACINILGSETVDECTLAEGHTGLANVAAGVEAIFDTESPNATCTQGGANSGEVRGPVTTFNPSGTEKLTFE
jgi:hypothetical protein